MKKLKYFKHLLKYTIMTEKIEAKDQKLRKATTYLKDRIRLLAYHKIECPSLLQEFKNFLYFIEEELFLQGDYPNELRVKIEILSKNILAGETPQNYNKDLMFIIESLKEYHIRMKNDIFTNFFSNEEKKGLYRIDACFFDKPQTPYRIYSFSELDALSTLWDSKGEFHLQNPKYDLIYIGDARGNGCKELYGDKKNDQNYRCKKLKSACVLAHGGEKFRCPNLENLVNMEVDFFEQIINGNYTTINHIQKPLSTS